MSFGRFCVQKQLGAGPDGARYQALDESTGELVELCQLAAARADRSRWSKLVPRLRLAALLTHPGSQPIRLLALESDPPYIVRAARRSDERESIRTRLPFPEDDVLAIASRLGGVLAEAHRIGLVHGRLGPDQVTSPDPELLALDFTGLCMETRSRAGVTTETDETWYAPEVKRGEPLLAASDIYAFGTLLCWLRGELPGAELSRPPAQPFATAATLPGLGFSQRDSQSELGRLLRAMRAPDPADRPSARSVVEQLNALCAPLAATLVETQAGPTIAATLQFTREDGRQAGEEAPSVWSRERLGRFRLLNKLGQGGMGAVFRAEDLSDGSVVAVKVLRPDLAQRPDALRRFQKEARLLAEIRNPFVTGLIEVNEDDGIHFLALEFVEGTTLAQRLEKLGKLDVEEALEILAQVARGLEEAHQRGIVHRDIKPQNILLLERACEPGPGDPAGLARRAPRVKLSDFGLARHAVQTESLEMTQSGAILGTPLYMAPEQCAGGQVSPATDVYAMGCTLFHLLAGRPPFVADTPLGVIAKHNNEPPPSLRALSPEVNEGVCEVVARALSKPPGHRYADAGALLRDLERLLRGEPTDLAIHPLLPACDPAELIVYNWTWDLKASARALWSLVSNTERLNRAVGLPSVQFSTAAEPGRPAKRLAEFRKAGITVAWEEHPFEWVEGRRMGVLREYTEGPWRWLTSEVELSPRAEGGTTLTHRIRIAPRGLMGRAITAVQVGKRSRSALERVYRRIDAALTGRLPAQADPFEPPEALSRAQRMKLESGLDRLVSLGVEVNVVERLGEFLSSAPAQEVSRIRPLALAERLSVDPDGMVAACLHAAHEGLLVLLWDLLCPVCRIPSEIRQTLRTVRDHGHCEACNLDYELDFASAIELVFRAHSDVRTTEPGTYCIGGPAHSPHVVAQARIKPGERLELALELEEGNYRLRGPQLPFSHEFAVRATAPASRCELRLARPPGPEARRELRTGGQLFDLTNDHGQELLVRIERVAPRTDALTAARASSLALFRELFPGEVLVPGRLIQTSNVTLLVTALDRPGDLYERGDDRAFQTLHELFQAIAATVKQHRGALVKTIAEGTLSVFPDPVAALQAVFELNLSVGQQAPAPAIRLKMAIHRGMAMAATLNDHLDYFGQTVNAAMRLAELARPGELVLSSEVSTEPHVAALLQARGLTAEVMPVALPGLTGGIAGRLVPSPTGR